MREKLLYKVGVVGCPSKTDVAWNKKNLSILKKLGFNALQLNIAWGCRPADEPLNLEDVVKIPAGKEKILAQPMKLLSKQTKKDFDRRRNDLKKRIKLCKENGFKAIFHFGAPYNAHQLYTDAPMINCVLDETVVNRYVCLMEEFFEQFPGVDDLWFYAYDQDSGICNEFGVCAACRGIPLHERIVPFVNKIAATWKRLNPAGRVWWEPWELSHGQALRCVEGLDPKTTGLAMHSNIGEVMITNPVDLWLKSTAELAKKRGIPLIVETFLGGPSEEVEPFNYLSHPLAVLRSLKTINSIPHISGIKEYYGLVPGKEDPNLRMSGIFFKDTAISEDKALKLLALPYKKASGDIITFWRLTSLAMELFPWNASWWLRIIGKCEIKHAMTAAFIRGQQAHTPSWESSRRAVYIKTDSTQPDPWLLEDVQLRCEMAAEKMEEALKLGRMFKANIPGELRPVFLKNLAELDGFRRRALSYAYHIRETNLVFIMRYLRNKKKPVPEKIKEELLDILKKDMANQQSTIACKPAIKLLNLSVDKFLAKYFKIGKKDLKSKGPYTVTSR